MKTATLALATLILTAGAMPARADGPFRPPGPPDDPLARTLFPPELIMKHQGELGITDRQRTAIMKELEKAQPQLMQIGWKLSEAGEQLRKLLEASRIDESKALAQADQVMALERQMKRLHLTLLIRIKNLLTDAQRAKLVAIRKRDP